jgi:formylglycine-generating enzyme required for sulfatase activity
MRGACTWGGIFLLCSSLPLTAQGAVQKFKQPNAYAVVIGISQYRADVIPKVSYAVKDAQAVASLLETQAGIPKKNIKLLTDSHVTLSDLRNHLGKWLRMRVKPDSTVYVYYAGHGTPNVLVQSGSIVPWDGHPDFPDGLYPLKELEDTLSKLPTKNVVVFLDSCFSGAAGRSVLAKGTRPVGLTYPVLSSADVMVLAAATGTQVSSDYDKAEHGLFTHYLLTGLQGEADTDKDQIVTLKELVPYVKEHVATTAVDELNREQTPVLLPGETALGTRIALPLAAVRPLPSLPPRAGEGRVGAGQQAAGPSAALTKAEEELKALEEQERQVEEQARHAALQRQIEEKKRQIEEKKKQLEVASLPTPGLPRQAGREITGKDGAPMVLVPAGEFLYGTDNRRLSLPAFYMDKYEVTTSRNAKFLQATGRTEPYKWNEASQVSDGERPVIGVDWNDADAYCRRYGKRLPTEHEWEKAARGTDGRKYPWGNEEPTSRHANFGKCCDWEGYATLTAAGEHESGKSPYGAYDMAGNVQEWTSSDHEGGGGKVVRGGSWYANAYYLESTDRKGRYPTYSDDAFGFRCLQDAPQ